MQQYKPTTVNSQSFDQIFVSPGAKEYVKGVLVVT